MKEFLFPLFYLLVEMAPYLLLGFLIAGLLHAFVPRTIYTHYLAKNNLRSSVMAALFGVPLPLCSCGVIPTAMSMRHEGASRAATVSFLIATPQTGVDSIAATASLMGLPFALLRPIAALATALLGGAVVSAAGEEEQHTPIVEPTTASSERSCGERFVQALRYGFYTMLQDIGKWLMAGLIIAGAITMLLPDNFFMLLGDRPLLNMLLVLICSVPMYLCATGSVPIAAALILKGLSPGAAFVLLMAGPATNMAAMLVIGKVLGRRTLWLYLLAIFTGAIGFGVIIDYLLPAAWFTQTQSAYQALCCGAEQLPWWKYLAALLFLGLWSIAMVGSIRSKQATSNIQQQQAMKQTFHIKGMMCNHCKANVERTLAGLSGVESVTVDLATGVAEVVGTIEAEKVIATIEAMGYEHVAQ